MHVLLFDIDGTLLNTGGAGQQAMERTLRSVCGVTRPTEGVPAAGRTDRAIIADLFAFNGITETAELRTTFQKAYYQHLAQVLPTLPGRTLPGVELLLESLSDRSDVLLGLLTGNLRQGASIKLGHYGIDHYFQLGGFGDEHINRDDVARAAMQAVVQHPQADIDSAEVWVIGDTPADVRCGRAIGARVVAVATGTYSDEQLESTEPDHQFADFSDPQALLALL